MLLNRELASSKAVVLFLKAKNWSHLVLSEVYRGAEMPLVSLLLKKYYRIK